MTLPATRHPPPATSRAVSLPAVAQTFLLPFDPEDHEDADEWKEYQGELSSKELQKVGSAEAMQCGVR